MTSREGSRVMAGGDPAVAVLTAVLKPDGEDGVPRGTKE